jgi:hypothetical protein
MSESVRLLVPYAEARHQLGGIGRTKLDELLSQNKLTRVHIGRRAFITAESINQFIESLNDSAVTA